MYFFEKNEKFQNNIMCIDEERNAHSYEEIWTKGDELIKGIPGESLVLLQCSNDVDSLSAYLALLRKRCPVILMGRDLDASLLDAIVSKYRPEFTLGNTQNKRLYEHEEINPMLGLLLSTSGSTGTQKLVRLTYDNIQANCDSIVEYLKLNAKERPITTLPMEYTYGLSVIHSHIAVGATIILTNLTLFDPEFWGMVEELEVSSIAGVPYSYEMMFRRLRVNEMNLPHLKTMTQAGGHLKPDIQKLVAEWAKDSARRFFVMYGQTEATARMSYIPPERCLDKIGSIGIPIPGGKIEIDDEELIYYGANVSLGYALRREDLAKGDENMGRLETGDLAYRDSDGYLYISGRKKRFTKLFGKRISLDQIQEYLQEHFLTEEIVCTGEDDRAVFVWTSKPEILEAQDEIRNIFTEKWGIKGRIAIVTEIDKIPRNSSGKVLYAQLKNK